MKLSPTEDDENGSDASMEDENYFDSPNGPTTNKRKRNKDSLSDLQKIRQKDVIIMNLHNEEKSLDIELEFGLKIYISFVVCFLFAVAGVILMLYAFGVSNLFKSSEKRVNIIGLCFGCLCFVPFCVWLYIVFCPQKEEYFRRKTIRLDRLLRNAVENKRNAVYFDEPDVIEECDKLIEKLEAQMKELNAAKEIHFLSKRSAAYVVPKEGTLVASRNNFEGPLTDKIGVKIKPSPPSDAAFPTVTPAVSLDMLKKPTINRSRSRTSLSPSSRSGRSTSEPRVSFSLQNSNPQSPSSSPAKSISAKSLSKK